MKDKKLLVTALSLILCLTVSIGIALAYFTDYEDARGGAEIKLTGRTETEEEFDGDEKVVSISNTGETDMVVRVLAFGENLTFNTGNNGDWADGGDGAWYYTKVLKAGESTSELRIAVGGRVDPKDPVEYDVTVVHEASRVTYDGDEVARPDGWTGCPAISAE